MRLTLAVIASALLLSAAEPSTQSHRRARLDTPTARLVRDFVTLDTAGGQLTPRGWTAIAAMFVDPGPRQVPERVGVYEWQEVFDGSLEPGAERASVGIQGDGMGTYDVRTGIYSTAGFPGPLQTRGSLDVVRVGGQWKIVGPVPPPAITRQTVLRLAAELRDTTTDPRIKRNAARTIAALKKYH